MTPELKHQEIKDKLKEILSATQIEQLEFRSLNDNKDLEIYNIEKRRKVYISVSPYKISVDGVDNYRILINVSEEEIPVAFNIDKDYTLECTIVVKSYDSDFYKKLITSLYSPSLFSKWTGMGNSAKITCFEIGTDLEYPLRTQYFTELHESHCISLPIFFRNVNIYLGFFTINFEDSPFGPINLDISNLKPNEQYYLVFNKRKQYKLFDQHSYLTRFERSTNHDN